MEFIIKNAAYNSDQAACPELWSLQGDRLVSKGGGYHYMSDSIKVMKRFHAEDWLEANADPDLKLFRKQYVKDYVIPEEFDPKNLWITPKGEVHSVFHEHHSVFVRYQAGLTERRAEEAGWIKISDGIPFCLPGVRYTKRAKEMVGEHCPYYYRLFEDNIAALS